MDSFHEIKINVIFSLYSGEEPQKLINTLYYLYRKKENKAVIEFLNKWYSSLKPSRKALYENLVPEDFDISKQIGNENKELIEKYKVSGMPTVYLNGYKFPNQYEYSDIEYYIDEIKNLTRESMSVS